MLQLFCYAVPYSIGWWWYVGADADAVREHCREYYGFDAEEIAAVRIWAYPLDDPGPLPTDGECNRIWEQRKRGEG